MSIASRVAEVQGTASRHRMSILPAMLFEVPEQIATLHLLAILKDSRIDQAGPYELTIVQN